MSDQQLQHQARNLIICCVIGLFCFFGAYMRIPVLPLFASSLGATTAQVGLINGSFMFSAALLAIPSGLLSDRIGQRPLLLAGVLTIALSSLLLPFSNGPVMMGGIYLIFGAGLAAFTPTMMSYVADVVPRSHLGRAYSFYTTAVYLGMTLGPAVGGMLGKIWGLGEVFWVAGGTVMVAFLVSTYFLPKGNSDDIRREEKGAVSLVLRGLFVNRRLKACLVGTAGGCFGFGMFVSFLPLHVKAQGLNSGHVGIIFATQALANVLLRIPFGRLSDRVDRCTMSAAGLTIFSLALGIIGCLGTLVSLSACAGVVGIGMGVTFTALGALVIDVVAREERGVAMGLYNSCIYLGMMASSVTMGGIIQLVGFKIGFASAGAFALLLTVVFLFWYRWGSRHK